MSWFEAYMLWNIGVLGRLFIALGILGAAWLLMCVIIWLTQRDFASIYESAIYEDGKRQFAKHTRVADNWQNITKRTFKLLPVIIVVFAIGVLVPSTETLLKIIATKKGVDAMQSETAGKYLSEVDKAVTNGFKLLNQEIETKLDKKEAHK